MKISQRERRLLVLLPIALVLIFILRGVVSSDKQPDIVAPTESIPILTQRLEKLRQIASTTPAKEAQLKQVTAELQTREKGIVVAETPARAYEQLIQIVTGLAKREGLDIRGAEEMKIRPMANDYGEISVTVGFGAGIEQLVNFLAALANHPQLIATSQIAITSGNPKDKGIGVRLVVSGVVAKKLIPEKKGVTAF